jgi:hypothetical protein
VTIILRNLGWFPVTITRLGLSGSDAFSLMHPNLPFVVTGASGERPVVQLSISVHPERLEGCETARVTVVASYDALTTKTFEVPVEACKHGDGGC